MRPRTRRHTTSFSVFRISPVRAHPCEPSTNLVMQALPLTEETQERDVLHTTSQRKKQTLGENKREHALGFELVTSIAGASCTTWNAGAQQCHTKSLCAAKFMGSTDELPPETSKEDSMIEIRPFLFPSSVEIILCRFC